VVLVQANLAGDVMFWQLGTGLVRSIITSKPHSTVDIIPVDMAANAVIAAGWHIATMNKLVLCSTQL